MLSDPTAPPPAKPARDLIEMLASDVRALDAAERRGDLAALRRMDPERPDAPAFFRMLVRHRPNAGPAFSLRCAHLVRLMALRPEALTPGSLGEAMAAHSISEARVQKLLAARGEAMVMQIALIARRMAQERAVPYREFAQLLLSDDDDGEVANRARLLVARDYFRALDRKGAAESA